MAVSGFDISRQAAQELRQEPGGYFVGAAPRRRPLQDAHVVNAARPSLLSFVALFIVYTSVCYVGLHWASVDDAVSPGWPAAGVGLVGLMLGGFRLWPALLLGRIAAGYLHASPLPFWADLMLALANTVAAVVPLYVVGWFGGVSPRLRSLTDVLGFLVGLALPAAAILASLGTLTLFASSSAFSGQTVFLNWLLGSFVGAVTVGPFLLSWASRERMPVRWYAGLAGLLAAITGLSAYIFFAQEALDVKFWHLLPLVVLAALLFDVRGGSSALLIIAVLAVVGLETGVGPFVILYGPQSSPMHLLLQFIGITAFTSLLVSVGAYERQARSKIRKREGRVRAALSAGGAGTFLLSADSGRLQCDETLVQMLGYTGEGPATLADFMACIQKDDQEAVRAAWSACIEQGAEIAVFFGVAHNGGSTRVAEMRGRRMVNERTGKKYVTGACLDITDREELAARVLRAEGAFRAIFEHAGVGVARFSPDGRFLEVNDRYCRMVGHNRETLIGASYHEFTGSMDVDADVEATRRLIDGPAASFRVERRYAIPGRPDLWLDINTTLVRSDDGQPAYFISVVQDVSIQKNAEERATARAEELEAVLTAVPAAIWVARDPACREVTGNLFASQLLRVPDPGINVSKTADDTAAVAHFQVFDPAGQEISDDDLPVQRAARGEVVRDFEERLLFSDGAEITLFGGATPLYSGSGAVRGSVAVFLDITARKAAEEREKLLSREVDHRAKNIMAILQAILRLTKADTVEAFRAAVVARISSLARTHSLLADNRWDGAELGTLIAEEVEPYLDGARSGESRRVSIKGPRVNLLPATAQSVALIVHELVTNAVKYGALSSPAGHLELNWSILLQDTGRMLRLDWRETGGLAVVPPSRHGFGLSLISSAIETQLGGHLSQEWREEGLVVGITFPMDNRAWSDDGLAAGLPETALRRDAIHNAGPVMVLDDEPLIALQIIDELQAEGIATIGPVYNAADALALINEQTLSGAILDVRLGAETSVQVADELMVRGVPFVFCTGFANITDLPERLRHIPKLSKPIDVAQLTKTVASMRA